MFKIVRSVISFDDTFLYTHLSKQTLMKNPFCVHPQRKTKKYVIILVIVMPLAAIYASP